MIEVFRNDDTNAFGRPFVRIKVKNAEKYNISKCMVAIGEIVKTYLNPQFPIPVYLTANETKKLRYNDDLYVSFFDNLGRKHTFKQSVPVKAFDEAVPSGDSSAEDTLTSDGVDNIVEIENDLELPLTDITIEFKFDVEKLSQLEDDIQLESRMAGMANDLISQQTSINDVDVRLSALGSTVQEDISVLDGKIDDNTGLINDLDTRLSALGSTVNENSLLIERLDTRLSALGNTVSDNFLIHEGEIEEINTKLSALGSSIVDNFLYLDNKIDSNSGLINEINTRLSALSSSVEADISVLDGKIEANTGLINGLDTRLSALGTTVSDNYLSLNTLISNHKTDKNNPHEVTKAQIGLGSVDNTSDLNKPISTATQEALEILDGKISINSGLIEDLNTRLSALGSTVSSDIDILEGKIDDNSGLIAEINTTLSALGGMVDINSGLISGLDTRLSALGTSVNGILNTLDGLETALHTINSGNN